MFCFLEPARRKQSKWKNGYSKKSLITGEDAAEIRDTYLHQVAGGVFKADNDCYLDVYGEHSVFRDPGEALAEYYMLLVNQPCNYKYFIHHNLKMKPDQLERDVPDVLGLMFDGSNALGVFDGKQISVGSIKWTGFAKGYKSSTQTDLMYFLSNKSEDDEETKHVELMELQKIRKIRQLGEYEIFDAEGKNHIINFQNTVIKVL